MVNEIKIFENPMFGRIRTMEMPDGQVGFVGKDVAEVLGYANPSNALTVHVNKEDKTSYLIQVSGTNYKANTCFINESGLYALIFASKLPQAKQFKHWVTSVVLPQIRKTGGYIPVDEEDDEKMILCKALMIYKRTLEEKDHLLEAQRPKVAFADAVTASDGDILVRDLAKLLTQNGFEIGQNRMFRWLRENGYIFKNETRPIQKWVEKGLFSTSIGIIITKDGTKEVCTTKVTGKGQEYFINGFMTGKMRIN